MNILQKEPAGVNAAVQAAIGLVLAFGVKLSAEQIAAILTFTGSLGALFARSQTAPKEKANAGS